MRATLEVLMDTEMAGGVWYILQSPPLVTGRFHAPNQCCSDHHGY